MEIIQVIEIANYTWGFSWIGLLLACLSVILFVLCIVNEWYSSVFGAMLAMLIFLSIIFFATGKELEPTIQYQVVLNNSMTVEELYEEYEIIEQKGISYIIQEKKEVE